MTKFFGKRFVILGLLGLAFLMLGTVTTARSAQLSFGFKLSGGIGYLFNGGGDLEKMRQGYETYSADWVETNYTSTFDWKKVSILPDFRFEAMLRIGPSFGVALGTGYLGLKSDGKYSWDHDHTYSMWFGTEHHYYTDGYTRKYKLTAIPLSLNLYYFVPMAGMNLYIFGGPSLYFGSLTHDFTEAYHENYTDDAWWGEEYQEDYKMDVTGNEKSSCTGFGFQGGLGFEIPVSPNISFGIEAFGRYAGFSNWEGDWSGSATITYREYDNYLGGWYYTATGSGSDSGHGFLYDYGYRGFTGSFYNEMWISDTQPGGSNYQDVHKASLNLNAVGVLASIIIHF